MIAPKLRGYINLMVVFVPMDMVLTIVWPDYKGVFPLAQGQWASHPRCHLIQLSIRVSSFCR